MLWQLPSYKGFRGAIDQLLANQYMISGEVAIIDSNTIEISELPVKTWTQVGPFGVGKNIKEKSAKKIKINRAMAIHLRKHQYWQIISVNH